MIQHIHKHSISIKHAIDGISWALKTQPNYRIHLLVSLISISAAVVLKISYFEFLIIAMLIVMGFVIETINTAIEQTTDAVDLKWREDIKIAKDVAAGAMLIFAIGSSIISCIIYIPRILELVRL